MSAKKHFLISLALTATLLILSRLHGPWTGTVERESSIDSSRRILRVTPTWEPEVVLPGSTHSSSYRGLWSILSPRDDGTRTRTIVLRVYFGPDDPRRSLEQTNEETTVDMDSEEIFAVNIAFEDIYKTIIFLAVSWILGEAGQRVGMPSLVGEMATGFLLGPPLADFVPFPEAMVLIGNLGLIGLILESGIDIDVGQLKETGKRAVIMAFTGTTLPLLVGLGLGYLGGSDFRSAFAVGASFAPSSLGVAGNALSAGEVLNTPIGQMIVASSVVDDVLGLILLSILAVLVGDDPKPFDFVLPFISSFGYLIVLGYSGVTWMPRVIENRILPRFAEAHREVVAFIMMFALLLAYLPLLNYSKASYLTGAFLAGLTFSQINSVHATFVNKGRPLLNWLLRIFFSTLIPYVAAVLAVLAKMPLGAYVPRFQKELPEDFPYNPYFRDVIITSMAMTCRGEFNFIIASFALGEGLFDAELYSAVVFAVLLSSIVCPLALLKILHVYNNKSKEFLSANHMVKRLGNTCDGYRPLYLAIQARTSIHWGMQESFKKVLEEAGLILIDHRSWHNLGLDSVDITEIFAQDTQVKVKIRSCFGDPEKGNGTSVTRSKSMVVEDDEIDERCVDIRNILVGCLESDDPASYLIQVSQWKPYKQFDDTDEDGKERHEYCLMSPHADSETDRTEDDEDVDGAQHAVEADHAVSIDDIDHLSVASHPGHQDEPQLSRSDLWDSDDVAKQIARDGYIMEPCSGGHDVVGGTTPRSHPRHRRRVTFDANILRALDDDSTEPDTIRHRLHGYVRATSDVEPTPPRRRADTGG